MASAWKIKSRKQGEHEILYLKLNQSAIKIKNTLYRLIYWIDEHVKLRKTVKM